jgi:hypothetical protein
LIVQFEIVDLDDDSVDFVFDVVAVLAVAFSPLLHGPRAFVPWDDPENFEQAHWWKGLRWRNVRWAFTAQQCVRRA